jgi:hypothetical protein
MAKVIMHQAKDGNLFKTAELCEAHDKLLILRSIALDIVEGMAQQSLTHYDRNDEACITLEDLQGYMVDHAGSIYTALGVVVNPKQTRKAKRFSKDNTVAA